MYPLLRMPIAFRRHTLPNGLTIVGEVDDQAHSAAAGFYVKTGARDEASAVMGVSHFLEHMMFKGTPDLSADELNRGFDAIGAKSNAFTSNEMTCFYAHVLPEHLPTCVDLLGRMMRPALRPEDFDTEKGVILEEIAMYKDNPFWVLYEACVEKHFEGHPLRHRVLGTTETITALTRDQMAEYFARRYSADNTVVSLAGRVDFDAACRRLEGLCGWWEATRVTRDNSAVRPVGGKVELRDAKVGRAYFLAMSEGPAFADESRYAATLLAQVLGASDNSLLHWALIEPGLAEEAQASYSAHDGFGEYFVFVSGDPERATEIWSAARAQLERLAAAATDDDLVRLRNKLATGVTLGGERPMDRMHRLGQLWTYAGRYRTLEEELDRINRVTLAEIRAVAERYPILPQTFGTLIPA